MSMEIHIPVINEMENLGKHHAVWIDSLRLIVHA